MSRHELGWRELCAIARMQILADPTIDDCEWAERIKRRLVTLKLPYPDPPHLLTAAMSAVQRAIEKRWGPRPAPAPPSRSPPPSKPQQEDPPWRGFTRKRHGWSSLADLIANLQGFVNSAPSSNALPASTARETWFNEFEALHEFYRRVTQLGMDRLETLRLFAEVAIERDVEWDFEQVRADSTNHSLACDACWVCRRAEHELRKIAWHHIIQVQHGGSNTPRNRVALCDYCHAEIHPWLPPVRRVAPGWLNLRELADAYADKELEKHPQGFTSVRKWEIARATMRCGFDWTHQIAAGESYLAIEVGATLVLVRCGVCAERRYQERPPDTDVQVAPVEEPGA